MQIRIISLGGNSSLVDSMKMLFPEADVGIQRGIDVRQASTHSLLSSGLITHTVVHTLNNGRRWHHEFAVKGGIGLALANRLALQEDTSQPLLLLEEDCVVTKPRQLQRSVAQLLENADKFDMAVFGVHDRNSKTSQAAAWLPVGFKVLRGVFYCTHCVLYTPSGREKVSQILQNPIDMQIDSLYGFEAMLGRLKVVGEVTHHSAKQSDHKSTVQSGGLKDSCCQYKVGMCILIVLLVLCLSWCICREARKRSVQ